MVTASQRRYKEKNRELLNAKARKYYYAHKDSCRSRNRKFRESNPRYSSRKAREYMASLKPAAYAKLGNRCSNLNCGWKNEDGSLGCNDVRCLQADHVRGGGHSDRKKGIYGLALYRDILTDKAGKYQLLCANCNWIKRFINKEHGHLRKEKETK